MNRLAEQRRSESNHRIVKAATLKNYESLTAAIIILTPDKGLKPCVFVGNGIGVHKVWVPFMDTLGVCFFVAYRENRLPLVSGILITRTTLVD